MIHTSRVPARRWYFLWSLSILIAVAALVLYLRPMSARVVVMTTGVPGEAYDVFARRYQSVFERAGVELRLMPSAGSVENLKRLNDPQSAVSVGFLQGGITNERLSPNLTSLGTICYEPVWFFYHDTEPGPRLEGLRGRKLSIGPEGSGTRAVALELLARNGIEPGLAELLPLTAPESGERLQGGQIQAAIMVASWDTPIVRRLLADPRIELISFARADAYTALYPYLTKLVLPTGVGNMAANRPPADTNLLATETSLVVRKEVSSAIQYLLLETANSIHSGPGIFQKAGQFPAAEPVDLPLSKEALQFYKSGVPFLQRYLPFRMAELAGKLLVILVPLVGIAYPLLRMLPALYAWSMRRRIFRLYGEVKLIEIQMEAVPAKSPAELLEKLEAIESRAIHMKLPRAFAYLIYGLRHHITLVRARLTSFARPV